MIPVEKTTKDSPESNITSEVKEDETTNTADVNHGKTGDSVGAAAAEKTEAGISKQCDRYVHSFSASSWDLISLSFRHTCEWKLLLLTPCDMMRNRLLWTLGGFETTRSSRSTTSCSFKST